uniref:G-protein coupled receptors family 1 profile domain-containing protein n=1 Tax=Pygocentrus nattereri TaxID=42514 RepID=A0A3B4D055_PYGNA
MSLRCSSTPSIIQPSDRLCLNEPELERLSPTGAVNSCSNHISVYALLCAGGLALNLAVVCVVGGFRKLRTASNAFIVNGCVADLLVCAVWMPQEAVAVSTGGGVGPPALRALREALLLLGITVSLLSHSLIAVNRYVLITKSPGTYQALYQKRHTEWMIAASWLISLASLLPWITGFGSRDEGCRDAAPSGFSEPVMMMVIIVMMVMMMVV